MWTHLITANKLCLYVDTSNYIIFGNRPNETNAAPVVINGSRLERVKTKLFLGVILDELLNWQAHAGYI